jgi:hypothetical protein
MSKKHRSKAGHASGERIVDYLRERFVLKILNVVGLRDQRLFGALNNFENNID